MIDMCNITTGIDTLTWDKFSILILTKIHQDCNDQKYCNIIFTDLFCISVKGIVTNKHFNVGKMILISQLMLKNILKYLVWWF